MSARGTNKGHLQLQPVHAYLIMTLFLKRYGAYKLEGHAPCVPSREEGEARFSYLLTF